MGITPMTDTLESDSDESLAAATEELVRRVIESAGPDVDDLVRRFPHAAEFLRLTSKIFPASRRSGSRGLWREPCRTTTRV